MPINTDGNQGISFLLFKKISTKTSISFSKQLGSWKKTDADVWAQSSISSVDDINTERDGVVSSGSGFIRKGTSMGSIISLTPVKEERIFFFIELKSLKGDSLKLFTPRNFTQLIA